MPTLLIVVAIAITLVYIIIIRKLSAWTIFASTTAIILFYLAKSDNIFDVMATNNIIGTNVPIPLIKECSLGLATVLQISGIIKAGFVDKKTKCISSNLDKLLEHTKEIFLANIENLIGIPYNEVNIRAFLPRKRPIKERLNFRNYNKKEFIIRNIDALANSGTTDNLYFEVYPTPSGIAGECYTKKTIIFENNLQENKEKYRLTDYQNSKTANCKFCLCCPIFDENEKIIAMISFDSIRAGTINLSNSKKLAELIRVFCQNLYQCVPYLFK